MSAISDAAYPVLNERVGAHQETSSVLRDGDGGGNLGFPSGFFGQFSKLHVRTDCVDDPATTDGCTTDPNRLDRMRVTVMQIIVDPLRSGEFVGFNFEEPEHWAETRSGVGRDLRGATRVLFDVRTPTPGGVDFQFGVGERTTSFMHISQSDDWTAKSISFNQLGLTAARLADQHVLFTIVTNDAHAPRGGILLIDNIRFDPVPTAQRDDLGLPVSNETFGSLTASNVPFPLDQVVRNLATVYESSITGMAQLSRGTTEDLRDARLIANTLVYAMQNDNAGLPIPAAPDGSVGLHSGYIGGGEIALLNSQGIGGGQQGDIRFAGFSVTSNLCGPSHYCLVLDGATGGNAAFTMLFLERAYLKFGDLQYLDAARTLGRWIVGNLTDTSGTGYAGYYIGYPDEGRPKTLLLGKAVENNADIFASMTLLAGIERSLGNDSEGDLWTTRAIVAGDFVMEMFDPETGRFFAGTLPVGQEPGPGLDPTGPRRGNDVINRAEFLDSISFAALAVAGSPRYQNAIDWHRPVQYMIDHFAQAITVGSEVFQGFNIVPQPTPGPGRPNAGRNGIAWAFTGQAVLTMKFVDALYGESNFAALLIST